MVRLSRNSRPQTQIGIRMGICMLWRQGFIPCHGGYPIMELNVKLRCGGVAFRHATGVGIAPAEFSQRLCFLWHRRTS